MFLIIPRVKCDYFPEQYYQLVSLTGRDVRTDFWMNIWLQGVNKYKEKLSTVNDLKKYTHIQLRNLYLFPYV